MSGAGATPSALRASIEEIISRDSGLRRLLVKLGLHFDRDEDEQHFARDDVQGKVAEAQLFLILFALFY